MPRPHYFLLTLDNVRVRDRGNTPHVHVVMQIRGEQSLTRILHSWKSYTAKRANEILGRQGTFWQREYFDRIVRDEEDLRRTIEYVVKNPEKAGLKNWRWVWSTGEAPA